MGFTFNIYLLGTIALKYNDQLLPSLPTQKTTSLLCFLMTHAGQNFAREYLAEQFWPERAAQKNRQNLYTALWEIRKLLKSTGLEPDEYLITRGRGVQWSAEAPCWVDAQAFQRACLASDLTRLKQAIDLYRGPFMDGFYDNWCIEERCLLEQRYQDSLLRLSRLYFATQQFYKALETANRLYKEEPLHEEAVCIILLAEYQTGNRLVAMDFYQTWAGRVKAELGIEPSEDVRCVYQQIHQGRIPKTAPLALVNNKVEDLL